MERDRSCYLPPRRHAFRRPDAHTSDGSATGVAGISGSFAPAAAQSARPAFLESEFIFPLEHWHNHASMIVELPDGDLLVCWFHGSGERTADDVVVRGARLRKGIARGAILSCSPTRPGIPTRMPHVRRPEARLWLMWPTILANEWHTALMRYKVSSSYRGDGAPRWDVSEVLHVTPGDEFAEVVNREVDRLLASRPATDEAVRRAEELKKHAADKLFRRLGWITRAHPLVLDGKRLIVPLYSDGFSFSLMAISDDWGATWKTSTPLVGLGTSNRRSPRKRTARSWPTARQRPAPKRLMISD